MKKPYFGEPVDIATEVKRVATPYGAHPVDHWSDDRLTVFIMWNGNEKMVSGLHVDQVTFLA